MGHTYTNLMVHGVFSTKERRPLLDGDILPELTRVIGGILRQRKGKLLALNGVSDHVHLLAICHPSIAVSNVFRDVKCVSCDWIHEKFPQMRDFAWQVGFGAFSVSKSKSSEVEAYIARQATHHKKEGFMEELIRLLELNEIEYDKRYIFD